MLKKILSLVCLSLLAGQLCFADSTVYLKSGKKIKGQIIQKDDQQIKIDISGVKITYFVDEIEKIEENAPTPPKPATTATAKPTTSPESAVPNPAAPVASVTSTDSEPKAPAPAKIDEAPKPQSAEPSGNKKDLVLGLIEASGTKESMVQMFDQLVQQAPADQQAKVREILNINEIINILIPVYEKYFTEGELRELIVFYTGLTGRKLIKVMPKLMEDSMTASMTYLQEKLPDLEKK